MDYAMSSPEQVADKIRQEKILLLSGDERLLNVLPEGNWIGGTTPCFMTEEGGMCTRDKIHMTELPEHIGVADIDIRIYDEETISSVYEDAPRNGFSVIIIPARSKVHFSFALNAPNYERFAIHPLVGWISGVHEDDLGLNSPKAFSGRHAGGVTEGAVVMHVSLSNGKFADIGIINIFEQGDGDVIEFPEDGFRAQEVFINGEKRNFGDYVFDNRLDKRLPLVADYHGILINTSFFAEDERVSEVKFHAPVFSGLQYKHAKPIDDYVSKFRAQLPDGIGHQIQFSCNCILNYHYSELHGEKIPGITGPASFGEIAYQLLNQTMVYLRIIDLPPERKHSNW